jgi:hypothetical protein
MLPSAKLPILNLRREVNAPHTFQALPDKQFFESEAIVPLFVVRQTPLEPQTS